MGNYSHSLQVPIQTATTTLPVNILLQYKTRLAKVLILAFFKITNCVKSFYISLECSENLVTIDRLLTTQGKN